MSYSTRFDITIADPGGRSALICGLSTAPSRIELEGLQSTFTDPEVIEALHTMDASVSCGLPLDRIFDAQTQKLRAEINTLELTSSLIGDLAHLEALLIEITSKAKPGTVFTVYMGLE